MGRNRFRKGKKDHNKRVARRNELLSAKKERERLMFMEQLKALQEASLKEHDVDVIDVDELGDIGDIGDLVEDLEETKTDIDTKTESKIDATSSNSNQ